jgi:hypothetical protein
MLFRYCVVMCTDVFQVLSTHDPWNVYTINLKYKYSVIKYISGYLLQIFRPVYPVDMLLLSSGHICT